MRGVSTLLLLGWVLSQAGAQALGIDPERPRGSTYALEGLGGMAGLGVGVVTGTALVAGVFGLTYEPPKHPGFLEFGNIEPNILAGLAFSLTMPAWVGGGVIKAGDVLDEPGSGYGAVVGAYAGALAGVGMCYLADRGNPPSVGLPVLTLATLAVPAGAVIGYNWNSDRDAGPFSARFNSRLGLPRVALGCERDLYGAAQLSLSAGLFSLQL